MVDAGVMELVVMHDSKSCVARREGSSPSSGRMLYVNDKKILSYVIGIALGDGNLSNPNGRAVRLRITCDIKYPFVIEEIIKNLGIIAPRNKISKIKRKSKAIDISCYSNDWENVLGWRVGKGTKIIQRVSVPIWIKSSKLYSKHCLRGLMQTDGSIYKDRGYVFVNFVNHTENLARDVYFMIEKIGFNPNMQILKIGANNKYTIRVSKQTQNFIDAIKLRK